MSQVTPSAPPRPRPRNRRRRVLLAILLLVLLASGGVLYFFWTSSSALTDIIAEIDRQDPGWRLEEIEAKRKLVPDDMNSALHIMAIKKLQAGQSFDTPVMEKIFDNLPPEVQLNEQQLAYLEKRFEVLKGVAAEARKLKDMPEGRFPITYKADFYTTTTNSQEARCVFHLLQWDAARRVHDFDADGAMESCLALHHAACSVGDEPLFIPQMVRYAGNTTTIVAIERTLAQAQGPPTETSLKRMQTALERELQEPTFLLGVRGDRAGCHHFLQAVAEGKINSKSVGLNFLLERFPGYLTHQHAVLLCYFNSAVEAAKLPAEEKQERFQELEKLEKKFRTGSLVHLLAPVFRRIREAERRTQANLRCAAVALAAERFRLARNLWPESLEAIVQAGFLDAVPADPYDGKPLRLKRALDGLIVYSVSQDKIDNDGFISRDRPTNPGTDLGFRLWDLPRRRQPPNPPAADVDLPK